MPLPRIILANDADEAGRKANQETAMALRQAGIADHRIAIVQWPENAPKGMDLNDVLKAGGLEAVRQMLENARALDADLPRCLSATDFIAANRPPLRYHIEGLLPEGGKLTFSATAKYGKSLMAIQMGFALAAGDCEWLGWKFGPPARVLYLQAEIMDGLLEDRLRWLFETMPTQLDRERAGRNFIIQEIAQSRPNLMSEEGRLTAEALVKKHQPQVLILDPLAALHPGLEENEAKAMSAALDYISGLTLKHKCAVILIHHHSKSGAARGSSVFEAWPESDLQAAKRVDHDCPVRTVPAGDVEQVVMEQLRSLFRSPELVARTYAAARQQEADETQRLTALKAELEEKIRASRERALQLVAGNSGKRSRAGTLGDAIEEAHAETHVLHDELKQTTVQLEALMRQSVTEDDVRRALTALGPLWEQLFPAEQNRIVRLLVDRVEIREDAVEVALRGEGLGSVVREITGIFEQASGRNAQ